MTVITFSKPDEVWRKHDKFHADQILEELSKHEGVEEDGNLKLDFHLSPSKSKRVLARIFK